MKTVIFWIFVAAALVVGAFAYLQLKKSKKPSVDAFTLIPDSCLVYLNTTDLSELDNKVNQQSMITDRLELYPDIGNIFFQLHSIDSIIESNEILKKELKKTSIHLAAYPSGWLVCMNIRELGRQQQCVEELASLLNFSTETEIKNFKFSNAQISLQMRDGILALSNSPSILNNALNGKNKFAASQEYQRFKSVLSDAHLLSVYVNQTLYAESKLKKDINLSVINNHGSFAGTMNFEPSELKSNGLQYLDNTDEMHVLSEQATCETSDILTLLPYNTAFFEAYACSNFSLLTEKSSAAETFWESCSKAAMFNVKVMFAENSNGQIISFQTNTSDDLVAVAINDTIKADESIRFMSDSIFSPENHNTGLLRENNSEVIFSPLIKSKIKFVTRIGSCLYFSAQEGDLVQLRNALSRQLTMLNNESFSSYRKNNFPDEFSYLLYTSPAAKKQARGDFFNLKTEGDEDPFANFKHLSYSLAKEKDYFRYRFHVLHETSEKQKNILWSTQLDTTVLTRPFNFVNHITNENEILVQDAATNLYLINAKGAVLWKKKIGEKIMSEIYAVDAFKNNKYQILFNTASSLFLIDRNGNQVEHFPVKLPAPASAALSIFDYEGNKDYRLIIPCSNKNIYNYMLSGKKVEGFNPVKTEEPVKLPVQYITIGESQYLIALDNEGKIYTFSRKGVGRIGLRNRATAGCEAFHVDASGSLNNTYLVYLDEKTAFVNRISFGDIKSIHKLSEENEIVSVRFCQVDENRSMDLLLSGGNKVRAYDFSGNLISETDCENNIDEADYYADESHSIIYGFSSEASQTEVFDLLHNNKHNISSTSLPLMKDLFRNNKQYLVVPDGNSLSCYLLN